MAALLAKADRLVLRFRRDQPGIRFAAAWQAALIIREALHRLLSQPVADPTQRQRLFAAFLHMIPEAQFR